MLSRGKKKVLQVNTSSNILSFDPNGKVEGSPFRYSKKRLDQSPNNQNKLSPGFNLFGDKKAK